MALGSCDMQKVTSMKATGNSTKYGLNAHPALMYFYATVFKEHGQGRLRQSNGSVYDGGWLKGKVRLQLCTARIECGMKCDLHQMAGPGIFALSNGDIKEMFDGKVVSVQKPQLSSAPSSKSAERRPSYQWKASYSVIQGQDGLKETKL